MTEGLSTQVRLSAQGVLLGNVPASLRAVSVNVASTKVYYRCIFDGEPTEDEWELLSVAATELIANFVEPYEIEEEYLRVPYPDEMENLKYLVFLRYEPESKRQTR